MNGIYIWQRGFPITIQAADVGNVFDSFGTNRANVTGDPVRAPEPSSSGSTPSAFTQPALGQFGNSTRNFLRGPTINNLDFALFKNFDASEGIAPAVPVRIVQRLQPPELQRGVRRTSRTRPSAESPGLVPDGSTSSG